jgi:cyanuric acid amidohydrolase
VTGLEAHVIETDAPDDTSGLAALVEQGEIDPADIVAILGKTEGNGCVNDFSRGLAATAYQHALADWLGLAPGEVTDRVALVMSGGTEGVMTPHIAVFVASEGKREGRGLAGAQAATRAFEPAEIGRIPQVRATADAVGEAMAAAGIESSTDLKFVQVKCPLLSARQIGAASAEELVCADTYESMGYSRGAAALGVAVAAGELSLDALDEASICTAPSLYSTVASTSAGSELQHAEVLVLGNSEASASPQVIGQAVMGDALDSDAVRAAAADAGVTASSDRVRHVLAKAAVTSDGTIRGRRHVIHDDSDINATRHARAVVSAVVGATTGDPLAYVSGGAEHQGPDGGGPIAVIAARNEV